MKTKVFFICMAMCAMMMGLAGCESLVGEDGLPIAGKPVKKVALSKQDKETMQYLISADNPALYIRIDQSDKFFKEKVRLISCPEELQAICPEGVTPPEIDFQNHCLIFAVAYSPVSDFEIKKVELLLQENGIATFYVELKGTSPYDSIEWAFPYAIFDVSAEEIKELKINVNRY